MQRKQESGEQNKDNTNYTNQKQERLVQYVDESLHTDKRVKLDIKE